ncbi:MAG: methyltransferase domain-containing protein [Aphanocapsa feldmannii 277cV]|uniref:Methyltransferase domain-containing protein n=2 Tax=Aphanocapsa feldmannii TaxID=192050 RepID=A0A524RKT7_9CHRO|nr:MAG: methyltransferase domain-containing protein [Aphanocapsa feldmannii 288cV]TGG90482.1 MAG: methyltransferase domain-containing protein [Aphanocapsa feldmannii 277cV]TGH27543.1 MAG: methyltransferase domain-containing protein [Aphanocapsa feldmannii 277cI]
MGVPFQQHTTVTAAGSKPLRTLAYRHGWIYETVTALTSIPAGGPGRLRDLCAAALAERLPQGAAVLDLCCGGGAAAGSLLRRGFVVTALDCSAAALDRAAKRYPELIPVQGLAENPPLADQSFAGIQVSLALHEFGPDALDVLLRSARRLLRPGGWLVVLDLHPAPPLLKLGQDLFVGLFETETATAFLRDDPIQRLTQAGFVVEEQQLEAGGALQRITAIRPLEASSAAE